MPDFFDSLQTLDKQFNVDWANAGGEQEAYDELMVNYWRDYNTLVRAEWIARGYPSDPPGHPVRPA